MSKKIMVILNKIKKFTFRLGAVLLCYSSIYYYIKGHFSEVLIYTILFLFLYAAVYIFTEIIKSVLCEYEDKQTEENYIKYKTEKLIKLNPGTEYDEAREIARESIERNERRGIEKFRSQFGHLI